jgi:heme-degrading monooxygenase HmoA
MILEIALLPLLPGNEEAFATTFAEAQRIIAAQPGYLSHELMRGAEADNGSHYVLLVRWQSIEAHDPGLRQSAAYQQWRTLLHKYYEPGDYEPGGVSVRHYATVAGSIGGVC